MRTPKTSPHMGYRLNLESALRRLVMHASPDIAPGARAGLLVQYPG